MTTHQGLLNAYKLRNHVHILNINEILIGTTTPVESGPGSNVNEEILHIFQISETGACSLVSYSRHLFGWGDLIPLQAIQLAYLKSH